MAESLLVGRNTAFVGYTEKPKKTLKTYFKKTYPWLNVRYRKILCNVCHYYLENGTR